MNTTIDPRKLLVNRSTLTLEFGVAGLPLHEFWTHVIPAENYQKDAKPLPTGSGYALLCEHARSSQDRCHADGKKFFNVIRSVRDEGIKEPVVAYALPNGEAELYGGHHRAVAALVSGHDVPVTYRELDPVSRLNGLRHSEIEEAYQAVESSETLASGRSYNPFPGRRAFRASSSRLAMVYRAVIDTPGQRLLDAGCNDGYFGIALAAHAFNPTFVDRSAAYCDVVKAKLRAFGMSESCVKNGDIKDLNEGEFDVVLYTDVFYHAALVSLSDAIDDWCMLMDSTVHRMLFSPGRWDKLQAVGFTEEMMWRHAHTAGFRIRYLGHDSDHGYGRPLFCLERTP